MKALLKLAGMGLLIVLAGCSSVEMKEPFPVSQLSEEERDQLEGMWKMDDGVLYVAFASNGVAQLAAIDWNKEAEVFELKTFPLHFAKRDESLYVSFRIEDEGECAPESSGYIFMEVKPSDHNLIVWPPNAACFAQLVENGTLKGTVEKGQYASTTVKLDDPAVKILELVATNPAAFDYKEPTVFQRLE
jgi:hypothetical protein